MSRPLAGATTRAASFLAAAVASLGLFLVACTERFEARSEYTKQRVLCGPASAAEWSAAVAECRQAFERDRSCLGLIGFRGELQGQAVAVQTRVERLAMIEGESDSDGVPIFAGFTAEGKSPYFAFALEAKQVGGTIDAPGGERRRYVLKDETRNADKYVDGFAELALRMTAGGESKNLRARNGEMAFENPYMDGIVGTFYGAFSTEGNLDGCFAFFGEPDADDFERAARDGGTADGSTEEP
jgi:hypothetical protein